jgi:phosphoglycerol transferase
MKSIQSRLGKNWQLKIVSFFAAILGSSAWTFNQVRDINPAILQDEWIYMVSSRIFTPWQQELPFDFGNYLFNVVYSSTSLCGDSFYTCAKLINLAFIQGFAITLFIIALRFLPFWGALAFLISVTLSPVAVYSSMYLPESMFFFLIGLTLFAVLKAAENPSWKNWALVGIPLGLTALTKPHALMAAMAIGIFLIFSSLKSRPFWKPLLLNAGALLLSFLVIRLFVGFLIAGPKALNLFFSYGISDNVAQFVGGIASVQPVEANQGLVGAGNVTGALGLFPAQFWTHSLVVTALMGAAIVSIVIAAINSFTSDEVRPVHRFAVVSLIWALFMLIAIVLFTGWITGSGDDHTTRVLERYYDYLFPIVSLAGIAVIADKRVLSETKSWVRWLVIAPVFLAISIAFAGYFGSLTIQIADAPNLAGLVVDKFTMDTVANLTFLTLLAIAFFPKYSVWAAALVFPATMILTGYQIQGQYQGFRLEDSAADKAGHFTYSLLNEAERDNLVILAETRFDGRVASFWLQDDPDLELLGAESVYPVANLPEGTQWVLAIGNLSMESGEVVSTEEGYKLYKIQD